MCRTVSLVLCALLVMGAVLIVTSVDSPVPLTRQQLASIIGGQSEGDIDCEVTDTECPLEPAPVGGANSPCDEEDTECNTDETWCYDLTKDETCTAESTWGWDCVVDPQHECHWRVGKCIDMLGNLVCAGYYDKGGDADKCGSVRQCHY